MMTLLRAWFFTQVATWALIFKKHDIALDYYGKILADRPDDTVTMSRIAFLYSEMGDRPRAINEFERVVSVNALDANSWFNLGFLRQENSDHVGAVAAFNQATSINERHDRAWYGKGLSMVALNRLDEAVTALKKNTELQPMSPYGHMELARAYFKLGDKDRCEKRMRKLKAFDPKNAAVLEDETGINIGIERWWKR